MSDLTPAPRGAAEPSERAKFEKWAASPMEDDADPSDPLDFGWRAWRARASEPAREEARAQALEEAAQVASKAWVRLDKRYKSPAWEASVEAAEAIRVLSRRDPAREEGR